FAELSDEAMKSNLKRLRRKDSAFIESAKLYPRGNQVYYHLAPAGAAYVGISEKFGQPVTDHETLVRLFGQLLFCCCGTTIRPKFTSEEFSRAFSGALVDGTPIARRFPYDGYYLDVDDTGSRRLGRILVDSGGTEPLLRTKKALEDDEQVLERFVREGRYAL